MTSVQQMHIITCFVFVFLGERLWLEVRRGCVTTGVVAWLYIKWRFTPDLLIQFCVVYVTLPIDSVKAGKTWVCIYSAFFWQRCAVQAAARLCRRWPGSVWLGTVVGGKASRSVWLRRGLLWLFFLLSFLLVCHRLQGLTDQRELLFRIND